MTSNGNTHEVNSAEASKEGVPPNEFSACGNNKFQFSPFCNPTKVTVAINKIKVPEIRNEIAWGSQVQIARGTDGPAPGEPTWTGCSTSALRNCIRTL